MFNQEGKRIKIIKETIPAVVSIEVSKKISQTKKELPEAIFPTTEKLKVNPLLSRKVAGKKIDFGGGSGFIADPSGIVVTNMHVVYEGQFDYEVTDYQNKKFVAKLIGVDLINDTAFLKIQTEQSFPFLKLGDSSKIFLGQNVLAIGNVLGLFNNTVSSGIISGLSRSIWADNEYIKENLRGLIQTDAAINPGNSGGPLINSQGEVIGINSASIFQAENIGFAIPINIIKRNLTRIKENGYIKKPFLGVRYVTINPDIQKTFKLDVVSGALVKSQHPGQEAVIKNSPAQKAKMQEGDIIVEIDGEAISQENPLENILDKKKDMQKIMIRLIRKGKEMKTWAIIEEK